MYIKLFTDQHYKYAFLVPNKEGDLRISFWFAKGGKSAILFRDTERVLGTLTKGYYISLKKVYL